MVRELGIDMLSASSHKFRGPKGASFLYIKNNLKLKSFMHGGAQERNRRAGTENIPAIIGMAEAAHISFKRLEVNTRYLRELRDYIIQKLSALRKFIKINGSLTDRLLNNINFSLGSFNSKEFDSESLIIMLDNAGICVSGGSACATGSPDASHILPAMGLSDKMAGSALRITLSPDNTYQEADIFIRELSNIIKA